MSIFLINRLSIYKNIQGTGEKCSSPQSCSERPQGANRACHLDGGLIIIRNDTRPWWVFGKDPAPWTLRTTFICILYFENSERFVASTKYENVRPYLSLHTFPVAVKRRLLGCTNPPSFLYIFYIFINQSINQSIKK